MKPTEKQIEFAMTLLGRAGFSTRFMDRTFAELGAGMRERSGQVRDWIAAKDRDEVSRLIERLQTRIAALKAEAAAKVKQAGDDAAVLAALLVRSRVANRVKDGWYPGMYVAAIARDAKISPGRAVRALHRLETAGKVKRLIERVMGTDVTMWTVDDQGEPTALVTGRDILKEPALFFQRLATGGEVIADRRSLESLLRTPELADLLNPEFRAVLTRAADSPVDAVRFHNGGIFVLAQGEPWREFS